MVFNRMILLLVVCPQCNPSKILYKRVLADVHPRSIVYWDYEKNKYLTPWDVVQNSSEKVWWKCPCGSNHSYQQSIRQAVFNNFRSIFFLRTPLHSGCPYCNSTKLSEENSLFSLYPELCTEWDYERNEKDDPSAISPKSNKAVYWVCSKNPNHRWKTKVFNRTQNHSGMKRGGNMNVVGCPYCAGDILQPQGSLAALYPLIAKEYHPLFNETSPTEVSPFSNQYCWWICSQNHDHVWNAQVSSRTSGNGIEILSFLLFIGCPFCGNQKKGRKKVIDTLSNYPQLLEELVSSSNLFDQYSELIHTTRTTRYLNVSDLPQQVMDSLLSSKSKDEFTKISTRSSKSYVWKCEKHHILYKYIVKKRFVAYQNSMYFYW